MQSNERKTQRVKRGPAKAHRHLDRFCDGDDLAAYSRPDDEYFDDSESDSESDESFWLPSGQHSPHVKRRLERYLEKKRLNAALSDIFDDDSDEDWMPLQADRRHKRTKRKRAPGA